MVSSIQPSIVRLNVGGRDLNIARSVFRKTDEASSSSWTLGDLFEGCVWDKRLPRSADDRVVLDESPVCVEELLCDGASKRPGSASFPKDEEKYLAYVASALGLHGEIGMILRGGNTTLPQGEVQRLTTILQGWCPGGPVGLELLYRASRDGWSGDALHARCRGDSPSTISLFRIKAKSDEDSDSVVGGFSSVPWTARPPDDRGVDSFLFMLKDGNAGSHTVQPAKWGRKRGKHPCFTLSNVEKYGLAFGGSYTLDLSVVWTTQTLFTANASYAVPPGSRFLRLQGSAIADIEVFRVPQIIGALPTTPPALSVAARLIDCAAYCEASAMSAEEHENDVHRFGASIAESLNEERVALHTAQRELVQANTMAEASVNTLTAVYGPHTAAGVEDPVVELSVRGPRKTMRMTTLLSTLRACPESALAARFDESKWPVTDKDKDAHGRRVIKDCSPSVFSKVLDVLRMKKREAWAGDDKKMGAVALVTIKVADRAPFEQFVNMYFPGCESFIMDRVEFLR
ncbi:unnamed protein product [Ectocarpus sp. 4 AP-2014]